MDLDKKALKKNMAIKGWSEVDLARALGVTKQSVNYLFYPARRGGKVQFGTIEKLAKVLEIPEKDLVKWSL